MAFYEIVGYDSQKMPSSGSTETLSEAKKLRDQFFATGRYDEVLIRQYRKDRYGRERYCVLHSLSKKAVPCPQCHGKDKFCMFCDGICVVSLNSAQEWKKQNLDS